MVESTGPIRRLFIMLAISGCLNVLLIGLLAYWNIREAPPRPYFELKPATTKEQKTPLAVDYSNSEVIRYFRRMPIAWLVSRLDNTQLVENGYTQRDLALASLVTFHQFDIDRAIATLPPPKVKRIINYGNFRDGSPAELTVYPGLSEQHFAAIRSFAETERWPLTSKGLFLALQKVEREQREPSLVEAFLITSDFTVFETLFNRSGVRVDRQELLNLLLDGSWNQLTAFVQQQRVAQDLSPARRQSLLIDFVKQKSVPAAKLLLKTDGAFVAKKIDDEQVALILTLIEEKSPEAEQFALQILESPRSDEVRQLAAERLYRYAGESMPASFREALTKFVGKQGAVIVEQPTALAVKSPPKPKPASIPDSALPPPKALKKNYTPSQPASTPHPPKPKPTLTPVPPPVAVRPLPSATTTQSRITIYTVQEGDSLWKISRRFGVDVEVIRAYNQLDSNLLSPGTTLKIPKKT